MKGTVQSVSANEFQTPSSNDSDLALHIPELVGRKVRYADGSG